jgi:deoxyadenosine/deoxycytidine kinase
MSAPIIVSVDGLIGAGKTFLLTELQRALPDVEVVLEPVGEWMRLKDASGKSLLELFYEDKKRWAYTFQNCAILTRLRTILAAMRTTTKRVILTERSVLTDRYVFAEMLRADGTLDPMEWELYRTWFDTFAADLPIRGVVYLTTGVGTSAERIVTRGRAGEEHIPLDYLAALDAQHHRWLDKAEREDGLAVLKISTEPGVSQEANVAAVRAFIDRLLPAEE